MGKGFGGFKEEGLGMLVEVVRMYDDVSGAGGARKRRGVSGVEEVEGGHRVPLQSC